MYLRGGGVAGGILLGGFPKVVKAVELTPNKTINIANNIVKLPHCVNLFNGCIINKYHYFFSCFNKSF